MTLVFVSPILEDQEEWYCKNCRHKEESHEIRIIMVKHQPMSWIKPCIECDCKDWALL